MGHKTTINWLPEHRTTVTSIIDGLDDQQRIKLHWKLLLFYDDVDDIIPQETNRLPGMEWLIELGEALLYAIPEADRKSITVQLPPEQDPSTHCNECDSTDIAFCGSYWNESTEWVHDFQCKSCGNFYTVRDKNLDRYANFFNPRMYEKYVKPLEE